MNCECIGPGGIHWSDFLVVAVSLSFMKASICLYRHEDESLLYVCLAGLISSNAMIFLSCPRWTDVKITVAIVSFILDTLCSMVIWILCVTCVYYISLSMMHLWIIGLSLFFWVQSMACYGEIIRRSIRYDSEVANPKKPEEDKKKD